MRRVLAILLLALALPAAPASAGSGLVENPSDPRNFTWVKEGLLAQGGGGLTEAQVEWLHEQGFGAIANFRGEHRDPEDKIRSLGMEFLDMPIDHAVNMNATQLRTFVAWAKEMEARGLPMYVHCTNGWHRAAAFVTAWEMERHNLTFDEASKLSVARRPGTVMRAPSALLAWEAELSGRDGLAVLLLSPLARPELGGEMPVAVEVLARGQPLANASVKVWSEESGIYLRGKTDEQGRYEFTYRAGDAHAMDHLYARASHEGFVDGADDVELFYLEPVPTIRPLEIVTHKADDGVDVQVLRNGRPYPARIVAWTNAGWSKVDEGATGAARFPNPGDGSLMHIRAESWGAIGARETVHLPAFRGEEKSEVEPFAPPTAELWVRTPPSVEREDIPANVTVRADASLRPPMVLAGLLALAAFGASYAYLRRTRRAPR